MQIPLATSMFFEYLGQNYTDVTTMAKVYDSQNLKHENTTFDFVYGVWLQLTFCKAHKNG